MAKNLMLVLMLPLTLMIVGCGEDSPRPDVRPGPGDAGAGDGPVVTSMDAASQDASDSEDAGEPADGGILPDQSSVVMNARAVCRTPEQDPVPMASQKALSDALIGSWVYCGNGKVPFLRNDTWGIRFDGDGTWAFLTVDRLGRLVRLEGLDNRGNWNVIDNRASAYSYQTNLTLFGGGTNPTFPVLSSAKQRLRVMWDIDKADYVRAP